MEEIWKDVIWFEWLYQVSNAWYVRSVTRIEESRNRFWKINRIRKWTLVYMSCPKRKTWWYKNVSLWKSWKVKWFLVHRLVAIHFIENILSKPCVNHIDWNKDNNSVTNLEWVSFSENERHSYHTLWKIAWNKWMTYNRKEWMKSAVPKINSLINT